MSTTEDHKEVMQVYEVGYLILPSVSEDKLDGVVDSIRKVITKDGGSELDSEAPFKHDLAYPMSKTVGASRYIVNDAYLGWIKFESDPTSAHKIKAELEKVDGMLRFLFIKAPRQSDFTFAKALEKQQAAEAALNDAAEALESPDNGLAPEAVVE
jgi:ribosomal protein S6